MTGRMMRVAGVEQQTMINAYAGMCKTTLKRRFGTPYDNQRKRPRTSQSQVSAIDEKETKCHSDNSWSNCLKITGEPEGEETVSCLVGESQLQMIIDSVSRNFPEAAGGIVSNALNYIDYVIVFGKNEEKHDKALTAVLEIFDTHKVVLNKQKCVYKTTKLKFLGHILSDHDIEADPEKVRVITDFRAPKTKEKTRSFLGLVTYVGKFIPDLANTTEPLRRLIKANTKFDWTNKEQQAVKETTVASPVAMGTVLVQIDDHNDHRIVSFASKSLTYVEKRYSQTEKESWALSHRFRVIYKAGKENRADSVSRLCQLTEAVAFDWQDEQNNFQIVAKGVPKSLDISEIMGKRAAPSELMFNRIIRDKIPDVRDFVGEVGESSERDLDCWNKQKGKEKADREEAPQHRISNPETKLC
ncbi:uncharacterized protein LOC124460946 [Drosophila willistoni]|uniref:uncharacterized protein LOC124460946 n=1 Tax=Drosophila willistoni TaxID=7260 RepID=UPI001F079C4F|nr:uncharacterized protein LOC124460946 [Drosophila willistoni]